jgi:HAD superfamily hydrolase (TIGR01509 family)
MIRALVFDFDGLILDTETALIDAYGDVHAAHDLPFDRPLFVSQVGHISYTFDPWRAFGPGADAQRLEGERRRFNRERNLRQQPLPGVVELIAAARVAGLRLGVASNSGHEHVDFHLKRIGLLDCFEFVACREDVASPKPEPDIYRLVIGQFGVRGAEAVAFEDSQTGVIAAKRAGLYVVAVPNSSTSTHDFSLADLCVDSLASIRLPDLEARLGGD